MPTRSQQEAWTMAQYLSLYHHLSTYLPICLNLIASTTQVDVTMPLNWPVLGIDKIYCHNLPPGVCCSYFDLEIRELELRPPGFNPASHVFLTSLKNVTFSHLLPGDIAAVWRYRIEHGRNEWGRYVQGRCASCSTRILKTGHGPGTWRWDGIENWLQRHGRLWMPLGGASYIRVPSIGLPPDKDTGNWLTMEGILGLAWGGGSWFASDAAAKMIGRGGSGGSTTFPRTKRGIRASQKGTVYAQGPSEWVYPNMIEANGTNFTGGGASMVYQSIDGQVLNLTSLLGTAG